jgi:hypothetical protein
LLAVLSDCDPASNVSIADLNLLPKWQRDKKLILDFLSEKSLPEDRDKIYRAYKERLIFNSYSCDAGKPVFNYSSSGGLFKLAVGKDGYGFTLYSARSGQEIQRVVAGDGMGLTMYEPSGAAREISYTAVSNTIGTISGAEKRGVEAGFYFHEDLVRASQFILACCSDKKECPKDAPKPSPKMLVQDPGVQK